VACPTRASSRTCARGLSGLSRARSSRGPAACEASAYAGGAPAQEPKATACGSHLGASRVPVPKSTDIFRDIPTPDARLAIRLAGRIWLSQARCGLRSTLLRPRIAPRRSPVRVRLAPSKAAANQPLLACVDASQEGRPVVVKFQSSSRRLPGQPAELRSMSRRPGRVAAQTGSAPSGHGSRPRGGPRRRGG
jgi:hypothetical protein